MSGDYYDHNRMSTNKIVQNSQVEKANQEDDNKTGRNDQPAIIREKSSPADLASISSATFRNVYLGRRKTDGTLI
jgi:hypothetical protein